MAAMAVSFKQQRETTPLPYGLMADEGKVLTAPDSVLFSGP
jgi:hypothetical protein